MLSSIARVSFYSSLGLSNLRIKFDSTEIGSETLFNQRQQSLISFAFKAKRRGNRKEKFSAGAFV